MVRDRGIKRAYLGKPNGRKPVGLPKHRSQIHKYQYELQIADWQQVAEKREEWRILVLEDKIHFGSLNQRK